jgi:rhodanese-related sulfurtransferase
LIAAADTREWSVEEVAARRQAGTPLAILDVREPWETSICAIEGSVFIPLSTLPESLDRVPQEIPLAVVCHHGVRSMHAVMWLREQGFDNAVNLQGGVDAWARCVDPNMATY